MAGKIELLNSEVQVFADYLMTLKMSARFSRLRTRFVKLLAERMNQIEEERKVLIKEFANLDENGNPKTIMNEDTKQEVFDIRDMEGFAAEYQALLTEKFIILQDESNSEMLLTIRSGVENDESEYSGQDALIHYRFCEIVEQVEA